MAVKDRNTKNQAQPTSTLCTPEVPAQEVAGQKNDCPVALRDLELTTEQVEIIEEVLADPKLTRHKGRKVPVVDASKIRRQRS